MAVLTPEALGADLSPQSLILSHYTESAQILKLLDSNKIPFVADIKHSGPQGEVQPLTIIDDPSAWLASDYPDPAKLAYVLTAEDITELDAAVAAAIASGKEVQDVTKEQFRLPTLGPKLEAFRNEVRFGRGWALIRGVPVQRYSQLESVLAYWGFGLYWGKALSQNAKGHILGHVKDIGHDPGAPNTRVYATSLRQPWHSDASDIVGLLCLKAAKAGGESSWSSSVSVHNELLRLGRQDLVEALAGDWWVDRKGEIPEGKLPYYRLPVFNYFKGYLSTNYKATYYELAQRHAKVPRWTPLQIEAIQYFNALARSNKLRLDYTLQPGDIQLISNFLTLHTRTEYEDHQDLEQRRHLLRLWVAPPAPDRPLPDAFAELYGSVEAGNRGGIHVPGFKLTTPHDGE